MIKYLTLTIICALCMIEAQATEKLLLYHSNKQVQWLHDGKKEAAIRGIFLLHGHSLIISQGAEAMVVQDDGKSILLNKPGTFTYEQVKLQIQKTKAESTSKNFFAYVFEKLLNDAGNEKQRVAAVVYRGKSAMFSPADSSFVFNKPMLKWKTDNSSIPYKIEMQINGVLFDTVLRRQTTFSIPEHIISSNSSTANLIQWRCFPADSKQHPKWFFVLMPNQEDRPVILQQLSILKKTYSSQKELLRLMEKDLLERWLENYKLH
jgi:hypothetical protein